MKFTDHPALKSVSGPIGQAGFDDGLDDLRVCPDRFDEFPVHARRQMSRACWASGRRPFRFDQMSVHPPVPAFADITHNTIHDDRINVRCRSLSTAGRPSALNGAFFFFHCAPSFSLGLVCSKIYESKYRTRGHCYSFGRDMNTSHGVLATFKGCASPQTNSRRRSMFGGEWAASRTMHSPQSGLAWRLSPNVWACGVGLTRPARGI
jgi:hypothetical protein